MLESIFSPGDVNGGITMLGSFRLRLFLVLAMLSLLMAVKSSGDSAVIARVDPYVSWVMTTDYGIREKVALMWDNYRGLSGAGVVPAQAPTLTPPCRDGKIVRHYGWYWNPDNNEQQFSGGVVLSLPDNTSIYPVAGGVVEEIVNKAAGRTVKVKHSEQLASSYGQLSEVLVEVGDEVGPDQPLGKSGRSFSFQLLGADGPLNPEAVFE